MFGPPQDDFSAGAFRSVARHLIPPNGAWTLENLLLNEDGSAYTRGGSAYVSNAAFGAGGLRWLFDGFLAAGQRTVFANAADFGVLAADGVTPVNLGGAGLSLPVPFAVLAGMAFVGGGAVYAGSRKAAAYSAGSVSVTAGSKTVTGAGTGFVANVDAGMLFQRGAGTRYYVVASVDSDTQVTLADPYEGVTAAAQPYSLVPLGTAAAPYRQANLYAAAGDKLVTFEGKRVYLSDGVSETGVFRPHVFQATEFHELPDGADTLGGQALGDVLYVFSTGGVWAVTNVFFPLTDDVGNVQRQTMPVSRDVILWGPAGLAAAQGAMVVPATDGVWLMPSGGPPVKLSRSVDPLYQEYVEGGLRPGQAAIFRQQYFLPVLDGAGTVVDLLVCRLDRSFDTHRGLVFPWTWLRGHGARVPALTVRVAGAGGSRQPQLLGAGADGRVLDLSGVFDSSATADADGSSPAWVVESRDVATGPQNLNTVRRLQARYESAGEVAGYVSKGSDESTFAGFGAAQWGLGQFADATLDEFFPLAGVAPASSGRDPHTWLFNARTRFIRARLQGTGRFRLRSLRWWIRPSGKDR